MKIRFCAALLLAALAIFTLTGCQALAAEQPIVLDVAYPKTPSAAEQVIEAAATPEHSRSTAPTEAPVQRLAAEEAEAIALDHAGVKRENLKYLRTEFDYDDGQPEYDIEFITDGWEYEYEIHAETGEILRSESEPVEKKQSAVSAQPVATEPPATEAPKTTKRERLTEAQVRNIALKHAGLKKDQVKDLKIEFDYDDGRPEYDVEFRYDGWEYEYEIHAETGKILSNNKEMDD